MNTASTLPATEPSQVSGPHNAGNTIDTRPSSLRDRHFMALVYATFFTSLFLVIPDLAGELAGQMIPLMPRAWFDGDGAPAVPAWLHFFTGTILAANLLILTISARWIGNAAPVHRALRSLAPSDATARRALRWQLWRCHFVKAAYLALSAGLFLFLYFYSAERVEILNALMSASSSEFDPSFAPGTFDGGLANLEQASVFGGGHRKVGRIAIGTGLVMSLAWLLHAALLLFPVSFSPEIPRSRS